MSGKFLIFGATGSIGSSLAEQLKSSGHDNIHLVGRNEKEVKDISSNLNATYTVANVLEIGVWRGGSLSGWANYFDNANVYGIDTINMFDINKHDGVDLTLPDNATFICDDAYNAEVLQKHFGQIKFDVIIDDGPHSRDSQLFTLNYFHDKMRKNGVIFIEDVGSWNDYNIECEYIYDNFQGDKNYLSVIDRIRNPHHEWNEYIIMYYAE